MIDPSIISGIRGPDIGNALATGMQLATARLESERNNSLRSFYAQNGPALFAGDRNALAGLAALDPEGAMGLQSDLMAQETARLGMQAQALNMDATRQGMGFDAQRMAMQQAESSQGLAFDRERMEMDREEARREATEAAAQMTADQRAQVAEQTRAVLTGAAPLAAAGDVENYNAFLQDYGIDPAQMPIDQFESIALTEGVAVEVLESYREDEPQFRPATAEEAGRYGSVAGQINLETGEFDAISPPRNTTTRVGPDGGIEIIEGVGGASARPLTEAEGRNSGFLLRMEESEEVLRQLDTQGASWQGRAAERIPGGNYIQDPEYQQFEQARRDFINALLRRESGAAIAPSEFDNADRQYFPVPGDRPEVIEQKRANREAALSGLRIGSGAGAGSVDALRTETAGPTAPTAPAAADSDFAAATMDDLFAMDLDALSGPALKAWNDRYDALSQGGR